MKDETQEVTLLEIPRYRSPDGRPTCGADFLHLKVCKFLRSKSFGTKYTCSEGGGPVTVEDSEDGKIRGGGYIRPCKGCIVWAGVKEELLNE